MKNKYITINPKLADGGKKFTEFCRNAYKKINGLKGGERYHHLRDLINDLVSSLPESPSTVDVEEAFIKSVLLDLIGFGWKLRIRKGKIQIQSPLRNTTDPQLHKNMVRESHIYERDSQLLQPSVTDFIQKMERRRLTSKGWHSIFSLMRDGNDLAKKLQPVGKIDSESKKFVLLKDIIQPYIQPVTEGSTCEFTGLELQKIWRYFRHTWVNKYNTLPGRSMAFLFRDAAAPNHPVIGIAALGSSVAQQKIRDKWIGWNKDTIVENFIKSATTADAKWLLNSLDSEIKDLYLKDLLNEGICHLIDIEYPTDTLLSKLNKVYENAIREHRLYPRAAAHKSNQSKNNGSPDWETQALTSLFKSKRCKKLAALLEIRQVFQTHGFKKGTGNELKKAIQSAAVRNSIGKLIRLIKSRHVGINMMDIVVCGAIAPYNSILGGKLICMMLCSPEIIKSYKDKYGKKDSIIASSMKGKSVIRDPQLVLMGTTSLYGVGSSQYNRVKIPCDIFGRDSNQQINYKNLGKSIGFGSYQFSETTVRLGDTMLARSKNGRRVNSIFGEGVNPKMRKLREAFDWAGLPSEDILQHHNSRIVYVIKLANNFRQILQGKQKKPKYLIPLSNPKQKTNQIIDYWRQRWLLGRITRPGIIDSVAQHTLSYPITHGARVKLPMSVEVDSCL